MANQKLKMACRALGRAYNDPDNTCNPELGLYIKDVLFELGEAEAESEGNAQRLARQYAEDRGACCGCEYKHSADRLAQAVELVRMMENALGRLLQRIHHNGGLGSYNGGPAFVMGPAEKALAAASKWLREAGGG